MSNPHKPISALVVKFVLGTATPREITQLEEWASLSTENRILLDRFNNREWLLSQLQELEEVNIDACVSEFHQRLSKHNTITAVLIKPWKNKRVVKLRKNKHVAKLWRHKYEAAAAILCVILAAPYLYKLALTRDAAITPSVATTSTNSKQQTVHHPHTETTSTKRNSQPPPTPSTKTLSVVKAAQTKQITDSTDVESAREAYHTDPQANDPETQPLTSATEQPQTTMEFAAKNKPMPINIIGPRLKEHFIQNEDRSVLKDHPLPDGSLITLNAASNLKYPGIFNGNKRRIGLNGEGYIEAKQVDSFPLLVVANTIHIETAGGTFNVRAYEDEDQTQITALTGNNLLVAAGPYETTIQPGQMAIVRKGSPIEVYKNVDTSAIRAYTSLEFQFNNMDLNKAAREIARWFNVTLIGADSSHIRVSFNGPRKLHLEDLKELIIKLKTSDNKQHLKLVESGLMIE